MPTHPHMPPTDAERPPWWPSAEQKARADAAHAESLRRRDTHESHREVDPTMTPAEWGELVEQEDRAAEVAGWAAERAER